MDGCVVLVAQMASCLGAASVKLPKEEHIASAPPPNTCFAPRGKGMGIHQRYYRDILGQIK